MAASSASRCRQFSAALAGAGRSTVGQQRVSVDARLVDPARRIARRHFRRAADLRARRGRIRRRIAAVRDRALDHVAGRVSRVAGDRWRAADAESLAVIVSTFDARERGPAIGTWTAWGMIAGALGPLIAGRDSERRLVALDLRHQSAAGDRLPVADRESRPVDAPHLRSAQGRLRRRASCACWVSVERCSH